MRLLLACVCVGVCAPASAYRLESAGEYTSELRYGSGSGELHVIGRVQEKLPLEHTDVAIDVSGFVARARVTQRFSNPFEDPIEAIYTFPLPENAAVDAMRMKIGERTIEGVIKRRKEAQELYRRAKERGQRAALLEQQRANIFTQSVANIMPNDRIEIVIEYVDILSYEKGAYELVFPMVVGPRYTPGKPIGYRGHGFAPDTDRVPDGSRTTPPVLRPDQRSGHDISLRVNLDAGLPIERLYSSSHALDVSENSNRNYTVQLSPDDTLPNKDFVLRYRAVLGDDPRVAVLPHTDERGGFFTLIVQPQRELEDDEVMARELIFVVDTSGSMSGQPMEKAKDAMRRLIGGMRSTDRFNVVRFAGRTGTLWSSSQPFDRHTHQEALDYVDGFRGVGGTEMAAGITKALSTPADRGFVRMALLLTDGFVDEREVLEAIDAERRGTRVFALGIGSSPNRNLLDRAALIGRGTAQYVRHDEDPEETIDGFYQRIDRPALVDIDIDWGNLDVEEVYPKAIPDLFLGQPLELHGRYERGGTGEITVRAQLGEDSYEQRVKVTLPRRAKEHAALASVWARHKIKSMMLERWASSTMGNGQSDGLEQKITQVGLDFRLMTQWTAFVAIEEKVVAGKKAKTVVQPIELPEGVSHEGVFGNSAVSAVSNLSVGGSGGSARASALRSSSVGGVVHKRAPRRVHAAMGSLSRNDISRVVSKNAGRIQRCYERALKRHATLSGRMVIEFTITAKGRVTRVKVKQDTLRDPELRRCIIEEIKRWKFANPRGGEVTVTYPFLFQPAP